MIHTFSLLIIFLSLKANLVAQQDSSDIRKCILSPDMHMGQAVYRSTDNMPVFKNGYSDVVRYITENLLYPSSCYSDSLPRSRFHITFIVDTLGKVRDACCLTTKDYYDPVEIH